MRHSTWPHTNAFTSFNHDRVTGISELDSVHWFSQCCSRTPHLCGCTPRGLWPPNLNSTEIFVQCTYPKFHHPVFTHSEAKTHTQTDASENIQHSCYATTLGKNNFPDYSHTAGYWRYQETLSFPTSNNCNIYKLVKLRWPFVPIS